MFNNFNLDIEQLILLAKEAGSKIVSVYEKPKFQVKIKADNSPLTEADKLSNDYIVSKLKQYFPSIPIISEEQKNKPYSVRKSWKYVWLVDPLDGTKEFVKRNGEFTVNVALLRKGKVVFGIVHVPVKQVTYYALQDGGAFKTVDGNAQKLSVSRSFTKSLRVVVSRSHPSKKVEDYVEMLKKQHQSVEYVAAGSSLKFCLVAEGRAHIYPRLGPTMEWDTAAGQIIAEEAGATVNRYDTRKPLRYNKENLLNPSFIVSALKEEMLPHHLES